MVENSKKNMNKRGHAIGLGLGALILVVLIVFGTVGYTSNKLISEHRYIGDKSNNLYYDLKTCETKNIDRQKLINFKSKEEAESSGYKSASCIE